MNARGDGQDDQRAGEDADLVGAELAHVGHQEDTDDLGTRDKSDACKLGVGVRVYARRSDIFCSVRGWLSCVPVDAVTLMKKLVYLPTNLTFALSPSRGYRKGYRGPRVTACQRQRIDAKSLPLETLEMG